MESFALVRAVILRLLVVKASSMAQFYVTDVFLSVGCFLTTNCEVAIVGELNGDNLVSLTLSSIEDEFSSIVDFWLSPLEDAFQRYTFRLSKQQTNIGSSIYVGCTYDIQNDCIEPSPLNYNGKLNYTKN